VLNLLMRLNIGHKFKPMLSSALPIELHIVMWATTTSRPSARSTAMI